MTLSTTTSRAAFSGNGTTVDFSFPYKFLANTDLVVLLVNATTGFSVTQALTTNYTVTGAGDDAGGTVTMLVAPPSGYNLVIYRDPAFTQTTDYVENDPFPAETHETALDKLTMMCQRLKDLVTRSFKLADSSTSSASVTVPDPTASALLGWNAAGTALENVDFTTLGTTDVLTSTNTPDAGVKRDANGGFAAGIVTADTGLDGNIVAVQGAVVNVVLQHGTDGTDAWFRGTLKAGDGTTLIDGTTKKFSGGVVETGSGGETHRVKVVGFSGWDMDTKSTKDVELGVAGENVRAVYVGIYASVVGVWTPLTAGGYWSQDPSATAITLTRTASGLYDSASYADSLGKVIITYVV